MKALSIKQPWADLILNEFKSLEIRSRKTHYRGEILICAGLSFDYSGWAQVSCKRPNYLMRQDEYIRGKAIGTVEIVDCWEMELTDQDKALVRWQPDLYCWELKNPKAIQPFPVTGKQGFFNVKIPEGIEV